MFTARRKRDRARDRKSTGPFDGT
ncbi:MAG: hypothetical protein K0Q60_2126, partial [Microvirga sp.]|nr:hypothetical protein [Microvirga sp.]